MWGPREDAVTPCSPVSQYMRAGKKRGADLHLPVGRTVLQAANDAVEFWRQHVRICEAQDRFFKAQKGRRGHTLDAAELPDLQGLHRAYA